MEGNNKSLKMNLNLHSPIFVYFILYHIFCFTTAKTNKRIEINVFPNIFVGFEEKTRVSKMFSCFASYTFRARPTYRKEPPSFYFQLDGLVLP